MITKWETREHYLARPEEVVVDLASLSFRFSSSVPFSFPSFSSSAGVFTPLLGQVRSCSIMFHYILMLSNKLN